MISVRDLPRAATTVAHTYGLRGAALRAVHEARRATGRFLAAPTLDLDLDGPAPSPNPFRISATAFRSAVPLEPAIARADRVARGEYQAYRHDWRPLPEGPEAWVQAPRSGSSWAPDGPWWKVPHFDRSKGDVKDLWEPARFGWAYDLVRGYMLTNDERYAESFLRNFDAWSSSSPAFRGPHWACGQETAIRATALLYAEANLPLGDAHARVVSTLAASGERIADAIGYAVSQRNNHGISEATGLIALGWRLGAATKAATRWLERGHGLLERLVREQFAPDGWYIQHSFTYMRVALDQCVIAERCLRAVGRRLSPEAVDRIGTAADLLTTVMECDSGTAPNHGANDGAYVHPVSSAPYRDFRPVVTAVASNWRRPLPADIVADTEALAWLGEASPEVGPRRADGLVTGASGWAFVRIGPFEVFLRAGEYASRPGHVDPLHIDVRVHGHEVIVDPGTFAYAALPPWNNGLASHEVHNGPQVASRPPGIRGPRFLWYRWPSARIVHSEWQADRAVLTAESDAGLRRTLEITPQTVTIRDLRTGSGEGAWSVRWLLHPNASPEPVTTTPAATIHRPEAPDQGVLGWFSPHYGERLRTTVLEVSGPPGAASPIITVIAAFDPAVDADT